ncbi:unnamed protein product [Prunus armeniaca]
MQITEYGFQTHHRVPPVTLRQLAILPHKFRGRLNRVVPVSSCYDIAPRVSGTLEPCGARIAAQAD